MTQHIAGLTRDALLREAVDAYFEAPHRTDVELLDDVFHPAAFLFDVGEGSVTVDPYASWRRDVDVRTDAASAGLERDGDCFRAVAKVRSLARTATGA